VTQITQRTAHCRYPQFGSETCSMQTSPSPAFFFSKVHVSSRPLYQLHRFSLSCIALPTPNCKNAQSRTVSSAHAQPPRKPLTKSSNSRKLFVAALICTCGPPALMLGYASALHANTPTATFPIQNVWMLIAIAVLSCLGSAILAFGLYIADAANAPTARGRVRDRTYIRDMPVRFGI
jgi:hypothetical protein